MKYYIATLFLILSLSSCSDSESNFLFLNKTENLHGEYIYRKDNESFIDSAVPEKNKYPIYSWEVHHSYLLPPITKEYFRCKGSALNPEKIIMENNEIQKFKDCEGREKHGLPLQNGREFVYPILIDLLNYIQKKTEQRVVITSGHRCPEHNDYVDSSKINKFSKHMIAAEVAFYVETLESEPLKVIDLIKEYYHLIDENKNNPEYSIFHRYENGNTNVVTKPWFNKEVFIKLFSKTEGRDFDNRHPYPYISIQVRFDRELNEKVSYTWNKAYRQYLRN